MLMVREVWILVVSGLALVLLGLVVLEQVSR